MPWKCARYSSRVGRSAISDDQVVMSARETGAALRRVEQPLLPEDGPENAGERRLLGIEIGAEFPRRMLLKKLSGSSLPPFSSFTRLMKFSESPGFRIGSTRSATFAAAFWPASVAVETEDRLGRQAPKHFDLLLGPAPCRARDDLRESRLGQRDHIHIAFDDDDLAGLARGLLGEVHVVELAPFGEERRLRRVQIFRLLVAQHPSLQTPRCAPWCRRSGR